MKENYYLQPFTLKNTMGNKEYHGMSALIEGTNSFMSFFSNPLAFYLHTKLNVFTENIKKNSNMLTTELH